LYSQGDLHNIAALLQATNKIHSGNTGIAECDIKDALQFGCFVKMETNKIKTLFCHGGTNTKHK